MKKELLITLIALLFLPGCEVEDDSPGNSLLPETAVLVFPARDELCTTGINLSSAESKISFKWDKSAHTNKYELHVRNLVNGQSISFLTSKTEIDVTLNRKTPYSWYVVSISDNTSDTSTSAVWKFYSSGIGAVSYPPFPAEIVTPEMAQNINANAGKITLDWNGTDVDADISNYDIYLSASPSPALYKSNLKESIINDVAVTSNTTYYWKVITRDLQGNTSESGIYQFTVN